MFKSKLLFPILASITTGLLIAVLVNAWTNPSQAPSGGGGALYYSGGNVGIGTTTPTAKLTIGGTSGVDGIKFPDNTIQTTSAKVVQIVNIQSSGIDSTTNIIPSDGTIPQNTEGAQFLTATITPKNANNLLYIDVVILGSSPNVVQATVALFQDSGVNAIAASAAFMYTAGNYMPIPLKYKMVAGTTSATTFNIRIGPNVAGTFWINAAGGTQWLGGKEVSSITITEVTP